MDRKKILIVSRSFYPDNSPRSFRTTELAKEFARQGHEITVITPRKGDVHAAFEKEHGVVIKDMGTPSWKPVEVKGKGIERLIRRMIFRFSGLLFEYPHIELTGMVKRALKKESGYDVMISIAVPYPVHWGVARVRTPKHPIGKVWVADCGDPYMGSENDSFSRPFYFKYVEKWFCRKANYITVPTQGSVVAYYPEFHNKIKVIPQGFRFENIKMVSGDTNNPVPTFGYAGYFIPGKRDPRKFLEYLVDRPENFKFHIYTARTDVVAPFVERSNGRIILHPVMPRDQVLFELSKMDFLVNFENAGSRQTPSKLIDYAILQKPILSVSTENPDTETTKQFLRKDYSNQYVINDPNQYRIENVCRKFLSLIEH